MAHGYPDWGIFTSKKTVYALQDMAELAARLGSIITFDRRGDLLWYDDFEENINKWNLTFSGVGANIALSTDTARNGGSSAILTTGDAIGDYAYMDRFIPYPVLSSIGFELSFTTNDNLDFIEFTLAFYDGSFLYIARVRYYPATDKFQYVDSTGTYQDLISDFPLRADVHLFHTMKLTIDMKEGKYRYFIINATTKSLEGVDLWKFSSNIEPHLMVRVYSRSAVAGNQSIYVDDAIITQNEP